ncbi:hypothetical protein Tco_1255050 [Tanacetum coccineum]
MPTAFAKGKDCLRDQELKRSPYVNRGQTPHRDPTSDSVVPYLREFRPAVGEGNFFGDASVGGGEIMGYDSAIGQEIDEPSVHRLSQNLLEATVPKPQLRKGEKNWLVRDQTVLALASPNSNELSIPEQTATGKGTSNPLMAGSLPKTIKPT